MEKKNIKDKIFVSISLIAYIIITFIITIHHENWRDEAQSFLIAKNLSFFDIFNQIKYEGHPFVFYYLVRIFTLFGFGYRIVNIISWIVMSAVAYIILTKSPFNKPTKILILLTVPFIYQYVAFGRSYCLVTLFTILLAYLYDKKEKHPYIYAIIIALLINTHVIMLGFGLMLVITFYIHELISKKKELDAKQKKKYLISLAIILVAIVTLVFQFCNTLSLNTYAKINEQKIEIIDAINAVFNQISYYYTYSLTNDINAALIMTIIIGVTIILTLQIKPNREILVLIGSIGYQILFVILLGQAKTYILMTAWIIYIFYLWIILNKVPKDSNNKYKIVITSLFMATCLISIIFGSIRNVYVDLNNKYSCSKTIAKHIEKNIEKGSVFLCVDDTICGSIIPYVDEEYYFYSLIANNYYTYISWDENRNTGLKNEGYISRINKFVEKNIKINNIYIIFNYTAGNEIYNHFMNNGRLEFEYMSTGSYAQYPENYYIYKIIK